MAGRLHRVTHDNELDLDDELLLEGGWRPRVAPGRTSITARLPARNAFLFRMVDPRGATTLVVEGPRDQRGVVAGADAAVERAAGSSGAALPGEVRARFEASLGADLGGVRVHTGADSAAAASAVGARAYTVGQDIHFAAGHYRPEDPFGMHLLAHEVAHTVQQAGGSASGRQHKLEVSAPSDAAEVEADRAADAMVAGQRAEVSGGPTLAARDKDPAAADGGDAKPKEKEYKTFKFVVKFTDEKAGTIDFDAADYATLYQQVKARADAKLEAGSCDRGTPAISYKASGETLTCSYTIPIKIKLPSWKQRASQPEADQKRFDKWVASVKAHEDQHKKIYKDNYEPELKKAVTGPTENKCHEQWDTADAEVEKKQTAFDAANQPDPLPAPGGITKVPANPPAASPKASGDGSGEVAPGEAAPGEAAPGETAPAEAAPAY